MSRIHSQVEIPTLSLNRSLVHLGLFGRSWNISQEICILRSPKSLHSHADTCTPGLLLLPSSMCPIAAAEPVTTSSHLVPFSSLFLLLLTLDGSALDLALFFFPSSSRLTYAMKASSSLLSSTIAADATSGDRTTVDRRNDLRPRLLSPTNFLDTRIGWQRNTSERKVRRVVPSVSGR